MTALEIIRAKKRRGELLTALETVIWEVCWEGINDQDVHQMKLAETAANELAAKDARIAELEALLSGDTGDTTGLKVCSVCERVLTVTRNGTLIKHGWGMRHGAGNVCPGSGKPYALKGTS